MIDEAKYVIFPTKLPGKGTICCFVFLGYFHQENMGVAWQPQWVKFSSYDQLVILTTGEFNRSLGDDVGVAFVEFSSYDWLFILISGELNGGSGLFQREFIGHI